MSSNRLTHPLLILLLLLGLIAPNTFAAKPNILFIFADDWGYGDLSCHGHPTFETPHLDKLAKQGTSFQQFTVNSGVCSPSRTAILTGHFPARYRINRHFHHTQHHKNTGMPDWLDPDAPMLPRLLKQAGYTTHHFGKWHLTNTSIPDAPLPTSYGYNEAAVFNGPGKQGTPDDIFDHTIRVINNKSNKPFFINLWIHETHTPHYPKKKWLDYYKEKGISERDRIYAAVVSNADEQIGRVLKALDDVDLADNTLVIFSSDNGPENTNPKRKHINDISTGPGLGTYYSTGSSGGLRGRKRSLFEGGVGVPLFVRWPGKVPSNKIDTKHVITGVDWLPTLCSIAGANLPDDYKADGEDRSGVLLGESSKRTKPIYWLWPPGRKSDDFWPQAAVRVGQWKLVKTLDDKRIELYDVGKDRTEKDNLADQHPKTVKELKAQLDAWLAELPDKPDPKCFSKLRKK